MMIYVRNLLELMRTIKLVSINYFLNLEDFMKIFPAQKIFIIFFLVSALTSSAGYVYAFEDDNIGQASARQLPFRTYLPLILSGAASSELVNGDFEAGDNGAWRVYSFQLLEVITDQDVPQPHSGRFLAWLGGFQNEVTTLSQTVQVSPDTPYLHFWYMINSTDTGANDFFTVEVNGLIIYQRILNEDATNMSWTEKSLDLRAFAGTSAEILFKVRTNESSPEDWYGSDFFLDDISLQSFP